MAQANPDNEALKQALKEALAETLHEQRGLLQRSSPRSSKISLWPKPFEKGDDPSVQDEVRSSTFWRVRRKDRVPEELRTRSEEDPRQIAAAPGKGSDRAGPQTLREVPNLTK